MDRAGVIEGSLMRIAESPQHVGQAEDVVWEQRGEDAFLSSHLVFSSDEHLVHGRVVRVRSRTIANCLYRRGRMVEEWVVRDTLAGALQRGLDPDEAARSMTFRGFQGSWLEDAPKDPLSEGDSGPRPDDHRAGCETVLAMIEEVWNGRHLHTVPDYFHRDLFLDTVGDVTVTRPDGYQRDLLTLLSAFPSATFEVRDVQTNDAGRYAGLRIAVLWKLVGRYDGRAIFGPSRASPSTSWASRSSWSRTAGSSARSACTTTWRSGRRSTAHAGTAPSRTPTSTDRTSTSRGAHA